MSTENGNGKTGDLLLEMRGLRIEGQSEDQWHEIVHGVDVTLNRGEVLGLIGESGAGKSVTVNAIIGLTPPDAHVECESLRFAGEPIDLGERNALAVLRGRRVAMVFQEPAKHLNPAFTIGSAITAWSAALPGNSRRASSQPTATAGGRIARVATAPPRSGRSVKSSARASSSVRRLLRRAMARIARPSEPRTQTHTPSRSKLGAPHSEMPRSIEMRALSAMWPKNAGPSGPSRQARAVAVAEAAKATSVRVHRPRSDQSLPASASAPRTAPKVDAFMESSFSQGYAARAADAPGFAPPASEAGNGRTRAVRWSATPGT